ncbi:MAG: hypothetical protein WBA74_15000, partial [Cyclobacteriaceae bacterium]
GPVYTPPGLSAKQTLNESDTVILNEYGRTPTVWIREVLERNEGYTHEFGDLRAVGDSAASYFDEVFDQQTFNQNIRNHYDQYGHPPFRIAYKSYEETLKVNLEGGPDETEVVPLLDETIGSGDLAVRVEVLRNIYGRIEYVVSINDEAFQASPTELAKHTWKDADGNTVQKVGTNGDWLDPIDRQMYLNQLAKIKESRKRMVSALAQDFKRYAIVNASAETGEILTPEKYPEYNYGTAGWFTKLTELWEIGYHLGHEFEMPEGIWNPEATDSEKWRTKSASSVAGIIDRSMQELADMAEMVELAQSLTKKETWTQILESLKSFSITKMIDGFITQGRERLSVLEGDSGVYKQYHAVGEVTAGVSFTIIGSWKQISKIGQKLIKATTNSAKKLGKRFKDFKVNFNPKQKNVGQDLPDTDPVPNSFRFDINTSPHFRKLSADQQNRLTKDIAGDKSGNLRTALAEKPELVDSWKVLDDAEVDHALRKNLDNLTGTKNYLDNNPSRVDEFKSHLSTEASKGRDGLYLKSLLERKEFKGTVYRGDKASKIPAEVFENGFSSPGTHDNLLNHIESNTTKGDFVSTTKGLSIADQFASKNGYVYEIRCQKGVDVNSTLGNDADAFFPEQVEVSMPGSVLPSDIKGAYPKGKVSPEHFVPNPNYVE